MVTKVTRYCQVAMMLIGLASLSWAQQQDGRINDDEVGKLASQLIQQHKIAGLGIGVIRAGKLQWTGYFGEQKPGQPITKDTMFNTASLAKTVAAETVLRLAARGDIDLDAAIADAWTHHDLGEDPRYRLLTPRLILSHQAGLLNWSHSYPDNRLAFIAKPGSRFSYSGAGYDMLAHYVQAKTGKPFEELVKTLIFKPLGLKRASISRNAWMEAKVPWPMDVNGVYQKPFTYSGSGREKPRGEWDAADDLYISVEDYAAFLLSVMKDQGMTPTLAKKRHQVVASVAETEFWTCELKEPGACPKPYGYGLGWTVFTYANKTLIQHGGTDFGEHAFAYFNRASQDGMVVFINGGNGWHVSIEIIDFLDRNQKLGAHFRALIAAYTKSKS